MSRLASFCSRQTPEEGGRTDGVVAEIPRRVLLAQGAGRRSGRSGSGIVRIWMMRYLNVLLALITLVAACGEKSAPACSTKDQCPGEQRCYCDPAGLLAEHKCLDADDRPSGTCISRREFARRIDDWQTRTCAERGQGPDCVRNLLPIEGDTRTSAEAQLAEAERSMAEAGRKLQDLDRRLSEAQARLDAASTEEERRKARADLDVVQEEARRRRDSLQHSSDCLRDPVGCK